MNERIRGGKLFENIQSRLKPGETPDSALKRITSEVGLKSAAEMLGVTKIAIAYQEKNPHGLRSPSESQKDTHKRKDEELRDKALRVFPQYTSLYELMSELYANGSEREVAEKLRKALGIKKFSRTKVVRWLHELNIPIRKTQ
jgi:hypothetical protein